jgi:hypothetical protein
MNHLGTAICKPGGHLGSVGVPPTLPPDNRRVEVHRRITSNEDYFPLPMRETFGAKDMLSVAGNLHMTIRNLFNR